MGNNKIYIKLIKIEHTEVTKFFDYLKNKYKVEVEQNKDTYSVVEKEPGIYNEIMDLKIEFGKLGKLLMVYKGGL